MRKQILSLAVALLIGSTVCMAQNRQNGKADREKRMEQIVADLGLNEKQAKDFKAAMEEMRPAKNKSNERPTREEMQKKRPLETDIIFRPTSLPQRAISMPLSGKQYHQPTFTNLLFRGRIR